MRIGPASPECGFQPGVGRTEPRVGRCTGGRVGRSQDACRRGQSWPSTSLPNPPTPGFVPGIILVVIVLLGMLLAGTMVAAPRTARNSRKENAAIDWLMVAGVAIISLTQWALWVLNSRDFVLSMILPNFAGEVRSLTALQFSVFGAVVPAPLPGVAVLLRFSSRRSTQDDVAARLSAFGPGPGRGSHRPVMEYSTGCPTSGTGIESVMNLTPMAVVAALVGTGISVAMAPWPVQWIPPRWAPTPSRPGTASATWTLTLRRGKRPLRPRRLHRKYQARAVELQRLLDGRLLDPVRRAARRDPCAGRHLGARQQQLLLGRGRADRQRQHLQQRACGAGPRT